ncbi:MAG: imidazole glycerol phosphate synthase subunit HisF [Alphaproteobacteria bacterium]|nr:imidazole glycerol phosphate synthase subunit HisF [Alphaproteobacteria bacterium]
MTRPRLIPVLLLKQGVIVRSQLFTVHQVIGNPMSTVERFSHWNVDELVLLDISGEDVHDLRREDIQQRYQGNSALDVLREVAKVSFMPLAFGGRVRTLEHISARLAAGADKVIINTAALDDPDFIGAASRRFGAQCVVVSIDAKKTEGGGYEVHAADGARPTGRDPAAWAREAERRGAGEIFLNSIDRDGSAQGYDLALLRAVTSAVSIPVIACGGVGRYEHFAPGIAEGGAAAVAAANIFHFFELSYPHAKQACIDAGLAMRGVALDSPWQRREPSYDRAGEDARIARRLRQAQDGDFIAARPRAARNPIRWCTRCVYPSISAAPMEFDAAGICMGCRMAEVKAAIAPAEWRRRKALLRDILETHRCRDGSRHDVVIAVSGGKDSWFQTHVIKHEFGLNPLLVTYDGNNWTEPGWRNMQRMSEVFGVDHIVYRPSIGTLKTLNRLAFIVMGDMNWHAHVGITTVPVRIAAQHKIPLVIWGEHGYLDLCGQFSMDDFPEMSYRDRLEHFARGYEWNFFVGREGLTPQDLVAWQYPSDRTLFDLGLRGIYLGNYLFWEANEHAKLMIDRYGFEVSEVPFERTYRRMSNLDDMHENGVHDYLKYIKFGYGRCTDHVCKDIRAGLMDRDRGIELVEKMDAVKPGDLRRWLDYVGMSEDEFDRIADTFRDPRVWRMEAGRWARDALVSSGVAVD